MELSAAAQIHMDQYETVERRNLAYFIDAYSRQHDVIEPHIEPNNSKTPYDGWLVVRKPNGTVEKILLEVKIRYGYTTQSFPDTVLTKSKYWGLRKSHKRLKCDKTWHMAFYEDGLFIYDLTPEILEEKELVVGEINTRALQSDYSGQRRPEPKFRLLHKGPESKMLMGFPNFR